MILVHKMKIGEVVGRDSCITATLECLDDWDGSNCLSNEITLKSMQITKSPFVIDLQLKFLA